MRITSKFKSLFAICFYLITRNESFDLSTEISEILRSVTLAGYFAFLILSKNFSTSFLTPCTSNSTVPLLLFLTQPVKWCLPANLYVKKRKPTPCTRPFITPINLITIFSTSSAKEPVSLVWVCSLHFFTLFLLISNWILRTN